jgi:hypothetical protein
MTTDFESRIRQIEDRTQISEQVIKYAMGVDRRDWAMFADCFTDPSMPTSPKAASPPPPSPARTWSPGTLPPSQATAHQPNR